MLRQVAKHVGHEINLFIDANIDQLLLIHRLHGIELISQDNQRTILNNLLYDRQVFQNLALLDANGKELMRLSRSKVFMDNELQNWATREEYLTPATSAKPFFGIIRFDNTIQEPLATISIPILNLRTGDLAYVLLGTLRFKKIWDLLDTIEIPGRGVVYVLDQANTVIAHPNPSVVLRNTKAYLSGSADRAGGLTGGDVILSKMRLLIGNQELTIVAEQPVSYAFALIRDYLTIAVVVTLTAIAAAILISLLAIKRIVRPINMLADSARKISQGNYDQQTEITGEDEIGLLAKVFNEMSRQLAKYKNEMEGLVQERTDQLAQSNMQLSNDIEKRKALEKEREQLINDLQASLDKVKTLSGFIPICASCKKIRDDKGYWNQVEQYITEHSEVEFSHGVCPDCVTKLYPEFHQGHHGVKKEEH